MKVIIAAALAWAGLSAAQLDQLPKCAMECFTQGMAASGCQPTDIACQCSTGMEKLMKVAVPCLCKSTCTAQDLMQAEQASNKICGAALSANGQTYKPQTMNPDACKAMASGTPTYGGAAGPAGNQASATGTPSINTPTYGGNNMTNVSSTNSASASLASYTGAAARVGSWIGESAFVGLLGFGLFAL